MTTNSTTVTHSLIHADCITAMQSMRSSSYELIFADPPYFLSSGGTSCSGGKRISVDKGDWDKTRTPEEIHDFYMRWLTESYRLLKDSGSLFVCGTYHNIFDVGMCLKEVGFHVRNMITWQKNPPRLTLVVAALSIAQSSSFGQLRIHPNTTSIMSL